MTDRQFCPICAAAVAVSPRCPNYLCPRCAALSCSADGRPLKFYNQDFSGGFIAFYADTNEIYHSHICFVGAVECRADEARFGGIVVVKL